MARALILPRTKLGKGANVVLLLMGFAGIFLILIAFFGAGFLFSLGYEGGWECRTSLNKIYIASQNKWYTASTVPFGDIPWGPKGVQFDPTPSSVDENWNYVLEPDINVKVDDPIHTKEDSNHELIKSTDGTKVIQAELDEYIREIKKQRGDVTYFYYHHAYATVITVKTQSDQLDQGYLYQSLLETAGEEGVPLVFTVRFQFIVEPWNIIGDVYTDEATGEDYVVTNAFAGVMAASYEIVDAGFTDRIMDARLDEKGSADVLATVATGWTIIKPEEHTSCNMYKTDSGATTDINSVPSDPSTIEGVPNKVYIDVSGTLQGGAAQPWFAISTPYDVFMQFTVRIDVLTAAGFTPVTGTDPLPDPPDDIVVGPVPFFYPLAYALGQLFAEWWWMVAVIIGIVFIILVLIVATRLKALFSRSKN